MADILRFESRKRSAAKDQSPIIKKWIDGELVEFVDFDMLTPSQQVQLLDSNSNRDCL